MRHDLGLTVKMGSASVVYYVDGSDLLEWVKAEVQTLAATGKAPAQAGTALAPWALDTFQDWVNAWVTLQLQSWKQKDCHLRIAGRSIKKFKDKTQGGGHADGFYMADEVLSGSGTGGTIWARAEGASYREFARHMSASMSGSTKHADTAVGHIAWSQAKAQKLRMVLDGTSKDLSGKGSASVSGALPLLGAVMFVSEAARNPRAFIVGLMLLDMIGERYSSKSRLLKPEGAYILDRVLAHPQRIPTGIGGSTPIAKAQRGPIRKASGYGHAYSKVKELVGVEGKWSASPMGSARTGTDIDIANDYIQAKEVSLVSRWVARTLRIDDVTVEALQTGTVRTGKHNIRTANPVTIANSYPGINDPRVRGVVAEFARKLHALVQHEIKQLIKKRATSFAAM